MNLREAVSKIKSVGVQNVRTVSSVPGKFNVEVFSGGSWVVVASNVSSSIAEDIIRQASSRVMLG